MHINAQQTTTVTAIKATTTASEAFDFEATDDFGVKVIYIYLIQNIFKHLIIFNIFNTFTIFFIFFILIIFRLGLSCLC